jgi:hypothetical protein
MVHVASIAVYDGDEWHFTNGESEGPCESVPLKRTDECATPRCAGREIYLRRHQWVHADTGLTVCNATNDPSVKATPKNEEAAPAILRVLGRRAVTIIAARAAQTRWSGDVTRLPSPLHHRHPSTSAQPIERNHKMSTAIIPLIAAGSR